MPSPEYRAPYAEDALHTPKPSSSLARTLAAVQGLYFLATGVWPLVHIPSFLEVTGPKTDLWLVYTVGALVAVVGLVLLCSARTGRVSQEVALLAAGCAAALAAVDVLFVSRGVLPRVYLLDAAVELVILLAWGFVYLRRG